MFQGNEPSHLKKVFVLLEPSSVLDTPKVTILVVIQDRRDFCCPSVWVVEVPGSDSSCLFRNGGGRGIYFVTGFIFGTSPGSRNAYAAPLYVVPISKARTSFREVPL